MNFASQRAFEASTHADFVFSDIVWEQEKAVPFKDVLAKLPRVESQDSPTAFYARLYNFVSLFGQIVAIFELITKAGCFHGVSEKPIEC